MKKNSYTNILSKVMLVILLSITILILPYPVYSLSNMDKRAVWLSYLDFQQMHFDSKESFVKDYKTVIDNIKKQDCNTIIVQVRAFSDAMYSSSLYPISEISTNRESLSFDPLKEMVSISHENNIQIEAWINPYRISLTETTYLYFLKSNKKSSWMEDENKVIKYGDYKYILNPANKDVQKSIVAGVNEVIQHYDVDGVQFDDYFYVSGAAESLAASEKRKNVNALIKQVYEVVKKKSPDLTFGISCAGNYENCMNEGADVDTWLAEEGYIDYLMPQIYWTDSYGMDGSITMFTNRIKQFMSLKRRTGMHIYAGLALYNAGTLSDYDLGWSMTDDNLANQIDILIGQNVHGFALFRYQYFLNQDGIKELNQIKNHYHK